MIKKDTIDRTLHFLNECKRLSADSSYHFNAHNIANDCHVSTARFFSAVKCGYFTKRIFSTGIRFFCNVEMFEPKHARKIIENESHGNHKKRIPDITKEINECLFKEPKLNEIPPSLDEVKEYCALRRNNVNANTWFSHYESVGWLIGKKKMVDWQAAIRTWEQPSHNTVFVNKKISDFSDAEFNIDAIRRGFPNKSLDDYSIDELMNNLKKRGITGNLGFTF